MNIKLQVFVSSTYTDLIEERQAAVEAILDAGHIPAGMELFKAGKSQMQTIQKWIDESDVYMLILGGRYGSIEEESGFSYTELEYNYAVSKKMPIIVIFLSDSFLHTKAAFSKGIQIFEKDNIQKYESFKKNIEKHIVIRYAENIHSIGISIHACLNSVLNDEETNLIGWIRTNQIKNITKTLPQDKSNLISLKYDKIICAKFENLLNCNILMSSCRRNLELNLISNLKLEVTITQHMTLSNIKENESHFNAFFCTTKLKPETLKVKRFFMNNIEYLSQLELSIEKDTEHKCFYIRGDIPLPILSTCEIIFVASYICNPHDFREIFHFKYPCNNFDMLLSMNNNIYNYSLSNEIFSLYGNAYSTDYFESSNDHSNVSSDENYKLNISFPNWSLPGSGYIVTLQENNL